MKHQRKHASPWVACTLCVALAAQSAPAVAAGTVTVRWTEPERYTDLGWSRVDREQAIDELGRHWQALAKLLPDGQTLAVEVTDVDLAGDSHPSSAQPLRLLRGRADWPAMTLRYTLSAGGQVLRQGQTRLADPNYLASSVRSGPLAYEKRMMERWLRDELQSAR